MSYPGFPPPNKPWGNNQIIAWDGRATEPRKLTLAERLDLAIFPEPMSGCWLWVSAIDHYGYGVISYDGRQHKAHRVVYERLRGPLPIGMEPDHICRVRCCVNPAHLESVTHRINMIRGATPSGDNARKTHCIYGHELNVANTYHPPKFPHRRQCRICIKWRSAPKKLPA